MIEIKRRKQKTNNLTAAASLMFLFEKFYNAFATLEVVGLYNFRLDYF